MTQNEHNLMIFMFAKQLQYIRILTDILKSREILDDGDFAAFAALVISNQDLPGVLLDDARRLYLLAAKGLGVDTQKTA